MLFTSFPILAILVGCLVYVFKRVSTLPAQTKRLVSVAYLAPVALEVANVILAILGFNYVESYQNTYSDCPSTNPYLFPILALSIVALLAVAAGLTVVLRSKKLAQPRGFIVVSALYMLIICLNGFFAAAMTMFCLTF